MVVQFLLLLAAAFAGACGARTLIRRDLGRLRAAMRGSEDGVLPLGAFKLRTLEGRSCASIVSVLLSRVREARRGSSEFSDLILASNRIAVCSGSEEELASMALRLMLEHGGRELAASILFRKSAEPPDHGWKECGKIGPPQLCRMVGSLKLTLDQLDLCPLETVEQCGPKLKWGYVVPVSSCELDFSVFGLGISLFVPLVVDSTLIGAIWIGFRSRSGVLDGEKRRLIMALAQHVAAALVSNDQSRIKAELVQRERDFLIGLSHDLRSPSTLALLAVRELQLDHLSMPGEILRERLESIESCLKDQLTMLDDVLDLSRHKHGLITAKISPIKRNLLEEIVSGFQKTAQQKGLKLVLEPFAAVDSRRPATVLADASHYRRIVSNLINNATKYTDRGGITVRTVEDGPIQWIEVEDSGRGILPEENARLFQPFSRLAGSKGRDGIGIGLAISRVLAELNGGCLSHAFRPQGGSIFRLRLNSGAQEPATENAPAFSGLLKPNIGTALIVDDDTAVCRMVRRMLDGKVSQIVEANCLSTAKSLAASQEFDLIVSDYILGDGTAADLFSFLDSLDPGSCWRIKTKAVVLSGGTVLPSVFSGELDSSLAQRSQQSSQYVALGAEPIRPDGLEITYLQKPVSREDLLSAIGAGN
jgi:signal transduction histidine kinase/CheY-like chemotaxis protein